MNILDYILEFIKVISLASIPVLIFYFRKPLCSLARALSDAEHLKWGKHGEYKRRKKELNKILDSLPQQPKYEKKQEKSDISLTKDQAKDKIISNLEEINLIRLKQFLVMSNIALSFSLILNVPELTERIKTIRDTAHKDVKSKEPDSEIIAFFDSWVSSNMVPPVEEAK